MHFHPADALVRFLLSATLPRAKRKPAEGDVAAGVGPLRNHPLAGVRKSSHAAPLAGAVALVAGVRRRRAVPLGGTGATPGPAFPRTSAVSVVTAWQTSLPSRESWWTADTTGAATSASRSVPTGHRRPVSEECRKNRRLLGLAEGSGVRRLPDPCTPGDGRPYGVPPTSHSAQPMSRSSRRSRSIAPATSAVTNTATVLAMDVTVGPAR